MLFRTHLLLGIIFFLLAKDFVGGNDVIFFLLVLFGSILPDIDEGRSKINRWSGFLGGIIAFFSKHRGFFHSLLFFILLFFACAYFWSPYYGAALLLGYAAHALGDGITPMGIQVFYPFSQFKMKGPIRTGSFAEGILFVILMVLIVRELF